MDGVVSLLDTQHCKVFDRLRDELANKFNIHTAKRPHISYQAAEQYDLTSLCSAVAQFVYKRPSFQALTSGLGCSTGAKPTLHIPVVRSSVLAELHQQVWQIVTRLSLGASLCYPDCWIPHITLIDQPLMPAQPSDVAGGLCDRCFKWIITLNHLSLLCNDGVEQWRFGCRETLWDKP